MLRIVAKPDFQTLFCRQTKCSPSDFEQKVLLRCLYPWRAGVARLIWLLYRGYFQADLEIIEEVRGITNGEYARDVISATNNPEQERNFLRGFFRIRMSRGRLLTLIRQTLPPE